MTIRWTVDHPTEDLKNRKNFEIRYHQVRENIASGKIMVDKMSSSDMDADFLTKVVTGEQTR